MSDHQPDAEQFAGLREQTRRQLLDSIGGWAGTVIAAIPPVVFVAVNAAADLHWAVVAAVASAAVLAGYRLVRRQSTQQAMTGLIGVVVASVIAARTGQAKGYFLIGIVSSFVYAAAFVASMLARRPLIGLLWEFLDPSPDDDGVRWHQRPALLRAYLVATAAGAAVFLARGVVQAVLYHRDATGWLAFARIAMGYPLYIAAVAFAFWSVRRVRHAIWPPASDDRVADVLRPGDEPVADEPA